MPAANDMAVDFRVSNSTTSAAIRSSIRGSMPAAAGFSATALAIVASPIPRL